MLFGRRRRRKRSRFKKFLIIFGLLTLFIYHKYNTFIYIPVDVENTEDISFTIKTGTSIKDIGDNLYEKGLIHNALTFYLYTKHNNFDQKIIAGRFHLQKSMNLTDIIEKITNPADAEYILTIQEGLRIRDIDEKLVDLKLIKPGEFISAARNFNGWEYYDFLNQEEFKDLDLPVEGYIYPDTYYLDPGTFKPHHLIYLALDNFERKIANIQRQKNFHEVVTMASIIENEVFGKEDKHLVSDILWRRYKHGWMIGADATLLYITEDRVITKKDLEIDSPYNTRKNKGLPPGPISNPSLESIQAALKPTKNNYWFYITTLDTGEVIYAKTNEEHNINRAKHL